MDIESTNGALAIVVCLIATSLPTADIEAQAIEADTKQVAAAAEDKNKENPAHEELRALRKGLVEAIKKNDVDELLTYLDPDVVVTWQNGEVSRKPDGVKAYYDRMMKGPQRVVDTLTIDPTVEELTHLYGDTGVAFGMLEGPLQIGRRQGFRLALALDRHGGQEGRQVENCRFSRFSKYVRQCGIAIGRFSRFVVDRWHRTGRGNRCWCCPGQSVSQEIAGDQLREYAH